MKFQVPQFIEMEDKIFGPLSFKEFIYLAGGAGLSYILYRYIPYTFLAILAVLPVMGFAIALAFYKVNNKPFIDVVQSALTYAMGRKLYIWKKENKPVSTKEVDVTFKQGSTVPVSTLGRSRLTDIGFNLDVKDTLNIRN
jgi:hypothetical protein